MMTTATYGYIATAAVIALIYFTSKVLSLAWQTHKIRKALLRCYPTGKVHWLLGHMLEFPGLNEAGLMWNYDMTSRFPRGYLGLLGPFPRLNLHHPETIKQVTRTTAPKQTSEGGAYGLLQTSAVCHEGTPFGQTHHLEIHGDRGTIYATCDWDRVQRVDGLRRGDTNGRQPLPIPDEIWGDVRRDVVHDTYRDVFRTTDAMTRGWISAIAAGEKAYPNFDDGLAVQRVLDAAVASAASDGAQHRIDHD